MKFLFNLFILLGIGILLGCSSSASIPTQPNAAELPKAESSSTDTGLLFSGVFDIDLDSMSISQQENRQSEYVYNITGFLPDKCPGGCFRFSIINIVGTVLEIELTIENPLAIQVYDVRIEYTNLFGKTVMNPDSYTDFLGVPVTTIFPFTAFAKEVGDRAFPVGPGGIDSETLFLDFPPGSPSSVNYSITASLPSNTGEPYEISGMSQVGTLTPSGGNATISCQVDDHQDNVSAVYLNSTPFTGNIAQMLPSAGLIEAVISNSIGAPIGTYSQMIMARSPNGQNINTYNYVQITVSEDMSDIIYVDNSYLPPDSDGSMARPFTNIGDGLNAATAGWEVWVDDSGSDYPGPITLKSDVVLKSVNWVPLDGTDQASINSTGSTPVVTGASGATIDGFKVYGGSTYGIKVSDVDTSILNCHVTEIASGGTAYGIHISNSNGSLIQGCTVSEIENTTSYGSLYGIYLSNSPITVSGNNIFNIIATDNYHPLSGIFATGCSPQSGNKLEIRQNRIHDVHTLGDTFGGSYAGATGIYLELSDDALVYNNLIYDLYSGNYNYHDYSPDIIYYDCGMRFRIANNIEVVNNTIYNIYKLYYYGNVYGILIEESTGFEGRNNIINNVNRSGGFQSAYGISGPVSAIWEYCDVFDATSATYTGGISAGTGCISTSPLFVNPVNDFHLAVGSPCINTGDPAIFDPDSSRSDMGCYGGPDGNW